MAHVRRARGVGSSNKPEHCTLLRMIEPAATQQRLWSVQRRPEACAYDTNTGLAAGEGNAGGMAVRRACPRWGAAHAPTGALFWEPHTRLLEHSSLESHRLHACMRCG